MTSPQLERIVLGKEHDALLRAALVSVLRELGGSVADHSWLVVGSQEIEQLQVTVGGENITVETETFIGLSLTGRSTMLDRIVTLVRQRLATPNVD